MAHKQHSPELELADSGALNVFDGDSAHAPKMDPAQNPELYLVSHKLACFTLCTLLEPCSVSVSKLMVTAAL